MGATKQMSVRMPMDIFERLESLAKRTGRTPTYYLRESVEEHLEDLEDLYLAEKVADRIRNGKEKTLTIEELEAELGLAD